MAKIAIVGTFHFPDRFDIFSEKTQKEIEDFVEQMAEWRPDTVAIELPKREQGKIDIFYQNFSPEDTAAQRSYGKLITYGHEGELTTLNEAVQVGFRLANMLGHSRVYGIDEDMELSDELAAATMEAAEKPIAALTNYLETEYGHSDKTLMALYRIHNDPRYIAFDHAAYMNINAVDKGSYEGARLVAQWYERNLKIFSNIQNLSRDKKRVLVLIGSSHGAILRELVQGCPNLELCEPVR